MVTSIDMADISRLRARNAIHLERMQAASMHYVGYDLDDPRFSDPNVRTGHSNKTGAGWMVDFNISATSPQSVFAMSDPLTVATLGTDGFADYMDGFPGVGAETGFSDDPDGDQLLNGVEAWFGTDPGAFSAGLAGGASDGSITSFSHPRNENPPPPPARDFFKF